MGDTFTIYRCRVCKAHDWAAEEVVHARHACPGGIDRVTLIPVDGEPFGDPREATMMGRPRGPHRWA